MSGDERVPGRGVGKGDGVSLTLRSISPTVEHHQNHGTLWHEFEIDTEWRTAAMGGRNLHGPNGAR